MTGIRSPPAPPLPPARTRKRSLAACCLLLGRQSKHKMKMADIDLEETEDYSRRIGRQVLLLLSLPHNACLLSLPHNTCLLPPPPLLCVRVCVRVCVFVCVWSM